MDTGLVLRCFVTFVLNVMILSVISQPAVDPYLGSSPEDTRIIKEYLRKYGYGEPEDVEELSIAVRKLQMFMNIPPVGLINQATLDRTSRLRCRVTDPSDRIDPQKTYPAFLHSNLHWNDTTLFYNVKDVESPGFISTIGDAVTAWINVTPLKFIYSGKQEDINIQIESILSENIITELFGTDSIDFGLAYPPPDGTIQLNKQHKYTTTFDGTGRSGYSLKHIMMHEIGHTLGLEHVPGENSIMNPYYEIFSRLQEPHENDVYGIKSLYVVCPENQTEVDGITLTWPATMKDARAASIESCPEYSVNAGKPLAFRYCRKTAAKTAEWDQPTNLTACLEGDPNRQATKLAKVTVNETNVVEIAVALAETTNNTSSITSDGLVGIADTLENVAAVGEPSTEVTISVVATVNNVLAVEDYQLENKTKGETTSKILQSLEDQVATLQLAGGNFTEIRENIGVKAFNYPISSLQSPLVFAKLIPSKDESYVGLNDRNTQIFYSPDEVPENRTETSISLPTEIIDLYLERRSESVGVNTTIPVTFTIFQTNSLFIPYTTNDTGYSRNGNQPDGHYCEAQRGVQLSGDVLEHVISATVEGVRMEELTEPVKITFTPPKGKQTTEKEADHQCVFWNDRRGGWATFACKLAEIKSNGQIVCACSHLTNFALLLTPHGDAISHRGFDIFNTVAICLSIIGLLITLIMYLVIPKLRKQPSLQIHMHFMVSLICLYVVFVCGIDSTSSSTGCICIAILLHYFSLSTVFLMGAEAVTMFYLFVSVKQGGIKQIPYYVLKAAVVAWGVPLLVVIVTVATSYCQYYNIDYCFLPSGKPLYFGEILPIGIVLLANLIIFSLVTRRITCQRKFKQKGNKRNQQKELIRQFYRVLSLFTVLGLSWIFGILSSIRGATYVFQILFAVSTTLQGVFIFLLFCARHQDVLATWKRWARRGSKHGGKGRSVYGRSENATAYPTSPTPTTPVSTTLSPIALHPASSNPFSSSSS